MATVTVFHVDVEGQPRRSYVDPLEALRYAYSRVYLRPIKKIEAEQSLGMGHGVSWCYQDLSVSIRSELVDEKDWHITDFYQDTSNGRGRPPFIR